MSAHLSNIEITAYQQGKLAAKELLALDKHLATCEQCRQQLSKALGIKGWLTALQEDLTAVATDKLDHIACEDFSAYVEEKMDEVEREIVESHLEICMQCAEELQALQAFLLTKPAIIYTPQLTWKERLTKGWQAIFSLRGAVGFAMLALVMLCAGLTVLPLRKQVNDLAGQVEVLQTENTRLRQDAQNAYAQLEKLQTLPSPPPQREVLVSIKDGDKEVILDKQGNLAGVESLPPLYQQMVKTAITKTQLPSAPVLDELNGNSDTLMGDSDNSSFALSSPVGSVVMTDCPIFRWQPMVGAENYVVAIYDTNLQSVAKSELLSVTEWQIPIRLARGKVYLWQVKAQIRGKEVIAPGPAMPEAKFKVLAQAQFAEILKIKKEHANAHLTLATIYAAQGLVNETEKELHLLRQANPHSNLAAKLLLSMRKVRK